MLPPFLYKWGETALLTKKQADFASQHHNLIYTFLRKENLDIAEFYDIAVFGYLDAVIDFFEKKELGKYAFSTLAWQSMKCRVCNHLKHEASYQNRLLKQLDFEKVIDKLICSDDDMADALLHSSISAILSPDEYRLIILRMNYFTVREIASFFGTSKSTIQRRIAAVSKKIKGMM